MFCSKISFLLVIFILIKKTDSIDIPRDTVLSDDRESEDVNMNFTELAVKYAGVCEEHQVITKDRYVLTLFRLPNAGARPVVLQHGNLGSADDFLIRGSSSLAVALHASGYDVWVSNIRGNKHARRHLTFDPDVDSKFWDFSLQEIVEYDITGVIDFIIEHTEQDQLVAVGYSVGTSMFYTLGAEWPEYNARISLMISLAPMCYSQHSELLSTINPLWPIADHVLKTLGVGEITGATSAGRSIQNRCLKTFDYLGRILASAVCFGMGMSVTQGYDKTEIEPEFTPTIMGHFPSSTSRKFLMHFAQIGHNRRFAQYDYGLEENFIRYGSALPPAYDLSQVDMRIALISGKDDRISTLEDVELLKLQLHNIVDHIVLEPENYNHIDMIWGRSTPEVLHPYIFDLLRKYT